MRVPTLLRSVDWRHDLPAAIVVFLLALPLTLGISLASGVPMFSGIITAVVGGLVVSLISKSALNISGPAASLAVIVLSSVQTLPSFKAFLLAVVLAGLLQIVFGILRAGVVGSLLPASVISGMLAAIGITIMLGQLPHAFGYDKEAYLHNREGSDNFGHSLQAFQNQFSLEAVIISIVSLFILIIWNSKKWQKPAWLQYMPGSLAAIMGSVVINIIFQIFFPAYALSKIYFVQVPVMDSPDAFFLNFTMPDFKYLTHAGVWTAAISMAIIASIQAFLGVEGVDKLDPQKRTTPLNRELLAQGVGNMVSGMLGGIILTSVIVRSIANVNAGARTRSSAFLQGSFLFVFVLAFPFLLNQIPLAALATVLVYVGFQLVKPKVFLQSYRKGWAHFIPFLTTIGAILWTDLLTGVCTGLIVAVVFILRDTLQPLYSIVQESNHLWIRFEKDLTFIQRYELTQLLKKVSPNAVLTLDFSSIDFIDEDNAALILRFVEEAPQRGIEIRIQKNENPEVPALTESAYSVS